MRERAEVYGMVEDAGAVIVDCSGRVVDPKDPNGQGALDYSLRTLFAAQERRRIRQRTMDGRRRTAAREISRVARRRTD